MCLWFQLTRHTELCLKENEEESRNDKCVQRSIG